MLAAEADGVAAAQAGVEQEVERQALSRSDRPASLEALDFVPRPNAEAAGRRAPFIISHHVVIGREPSNHVGKIAAAPDPRPDSRTAARPSNGRELRAGPGASFGPASFREPGRCAKSARNRSCSVPGGALPSAMPDDAELTPARPEDLRACIAYALTSDGRLAKTQSAELMASIVAERLIARLERDGFVIMRRPGLAGHSALGRGFENR